LRVGVIVVSMLMVATPSEASQSCMSKTEARQHFGSVHIYWHGQDHCWDATPTRHHHAPAHHRKFAPDVPAPNWCYRSRRWSSVIGASGQNQIATLTTAMCFSPMN